MIDSPPPPDAESARPASLPSPFLATLQRQLADPHGRGNRAALRRYWSPTTRHQAWPVLGAVSALDDNAYHAARAVVAALFAVHPKHQPGQTVGRAAARLGKREDGAHPYDRHFRRLLASETLGTVDTPADLSLQLHRLVQRLDAEGLGLDYDLLLKDLQDWSRWNRADRIKLRWARDFWQVPTLPQNALDSEA